MNGQKQKCSIFLKIFLLMLASSAGPCIIMGIYELIKYHKVIYGKGNPLMIVIGCTILLSVVIAGTITRDILLPIRLLLDAIKAYRVNRALPNFSNVNQGNEFDYLFEEYEKMTSDISNYQIELAKNARLAAVGEIVNHVAHDLRSPLQTLLDSITRIENKAQGDGEIAAYTDAVRQSAGRIKLMADDLLDYKKAREIQPAPVSVEKLLNDSLKDMLVPARQRGVKILTSASSNMTLNVDAYKLQRVIANIVLNAIQAIPHDHGVVEIAVSSLLPFEKGGAGGISQSPFTLTIKDNGCGIKQEHLAKVFDCSFTFGKKGGTGLGLAYCLNVIEAHKGTLNVESEEGKGTKFTISLPESVILSKGDNVASKPILIDSSIADKPANGKPSWMLVANEPEIKKTWHALSAKHESTIGTEIEALEDLIKKKIDYFALKGVIIDCAFGQSGLGMTDVVDIAVHVRSRGVQNIHLFTSEQLPEKFKKRFETNGVNIRSKPLNEDSYKTIFLNEN